MENRAAVFTSQPQDVEVFRNGAWEPGSLLGWRHDAEGLCQVWVRLLAAGLEETTWTALEYLRLPDPESPMHALSAVDALGAGRDAEPPLTGTMTAIRPVPVPAPRPAAALAGPSELTATINLFAVRGHDDSAAAEEAARCGRSGGRRRAPDGLDAGRERAEERRPAVVATPGRHRAPAAEVAVGRHRAADTGVWPAVRADEAPEPAHPSPPASATGWEGSDVDLLTRPMRLDDVPGRMPQPRRAHRDAWLAGR
jgi:hypothetical protein